MSYATISVLGKAKKLYIESLMKYVVSSQEKLQNFPIYSVHSDIDSFILYNAEIDPPHEIKVLADKIEEIANEKSSVRIQEIFENHETSDKPEETKKPDLPIKQIPENPDTNYEHEILWYLEFDGSVNKLGARAGLWVHNLENNHAKGHAYRLNFRCTNNMAEYEALLLGLKLVKKLGATRVSVLGDFDLIIQQIKGKFLANDPRLREYRGTAIEILNTFLETQLAKIPRKHNLQAHSLATFSNTCKLPFEPNHQFTAEIRHRPAIPDNVKNWQVFDNDNQINNFLTLEEEFSSTNVDVDTISEFGPTNQIETDISTENATQMHHPMKFTKKEI